MPAAASTIWPCRALPAPGKTEVFGVRCSANPHTAALYLSDASVAADSLNRKGLSHDLPLLRIAKRSARAQPQRHPTLPLPSLPQDIFREAPHHRKPTASEFS